MPIGTTAMGKAILAGMTKEAAQEVLTGHTVPRSLQAELEQVRQRGHAIDNEDNEPGVACIGASIRDAEGLPTAAVSISGPVHRILVREREIAKALHSVCQRVSEQLGFVAAADPARAGRGSKTLPRAGTA